MRKVEKWGTRQRGIVLISSLVLSLLLLMLVSAGYVLVGGKGGSVTSYQSRDAALEAAESGYRYAMTQLQKDHNWQGNSPLLYPVNVTNEIVVKEDHGNVIGFVYDRLGRVSQFRIRFNFQNSGSPDPKDNLGVSGTPLNTTFVSCNNLAAKSPVPIPMYRADAGTYKVTKTSATPAQVSGGTCHLIVEGFAGDALSSTSPTTTPYPPAAGGTVSHEIVESVLGIGAVTNNDASVYAGNGFNVTGSGTVEVKTPNAGTSPRVRILGALALDAAVKYKSVSGRITEETSAANPSAPQLVGGVTVEHVANATQYSFFPKTKWSFAAAQGGPGQNLQAGTYIWRSDGSLEYFNQDYTSATVLPTAGTGTNGATLLPAAMTFNSVTHSIDITDTVNVTNTTTANGIHFVVDPTFYTTFTDRPHLNFAPASSSVSAILRTTTGNATWQGAAQGQGSIVANGTISLQGTSALEAKIDDNVALYARGDVNITSIPPVVASALTALFPSQPPGKRVGQQDNEEKQGEWKGPKNPIPAGLPVDLFGGSASGQDVRLRGSIFAQGNFTADITGTLGVRGLVTAYGGDPENVAIANPGSVPLTGVVNISSANSQFMFDPLYAAPGGGGAATSGPLSRITCDIYKR